MVDAKQGIEIPVILTPDGAVKGLEVIARKMQELEGAATKAGGALDKVGGGPKPAGGGGQGAGGAGQGGGSGSTPFFESRMGEFTRQVAMAGLTFVERALPQILDPTKSNVERAMALGPTAARLTAQLSTGASLAAMETKIGGTGMDMPEELKRQIIQTAGVAAEEAAKAGMAAMRAEMESARAGATSTLMPFAQMGVMPDEETLKEIIGSYRKVGQREYALRKMVSEGMDASFTGAVDDSLMKQLNGPSALDANGIIDRYPGQFSGAKAGGG